jgi:hypothetical protein
MEDYTWLNAELQQLQTKIAEKQWLNKRLEEVKTEVTQQELRVQDLYEKRNKETAEVENLETLSLVGLFYTILGTKEQQLEKERQEALRAQLTYDEARRSLELLRADLANIQSRFKAIGEVETAFQAKLETKLSLLLMSAHPVAIELKNQHTQWQQLQLQQREILEALEVAKQYQDWLLLLIRQIQQAKNWGTWDLMGGGMLASMAKHNHLANARETVAGLRHHAFRLKKELADLNHTLHTDIDLDAFERFVDIFFDNLFFDWMVQQKILKSLESAETLRYELHGLIMKLADEYSQMVKRVQSEEEILKTKILNAG